MLYRGCFGLVMTILLSCMIKHYRNYILNLIISYLYTTNISIRNQQVSIFPKTAIKSQKDFEGMLNDTHQFHHEIEISDPQSLLEQTSLERWF